jgi:hypothetical protein
LSEFSGSFDRTIPTCLAASSVTVRNGSVCIASLMFNPTEKLQPIMSEVNLPKLIFFLIS